MDSRIIKKVAGVIPAIFFFIIFFYNINLLAGILEDVKALKIGLDNFYIGEKLKITKNLKKVKQSYKGTEKYIFKDIFITVTEKDKIIVGIYKKFDNVSYDNFKKTISFLMMKFGEPTIEAHEKTIYWFYSKKGKIENSEFLEQKKAGSIKKPILMVKFHSDKLFSEIKNHKKNSFYFIIYSELIIKKFVR